MWSQKEIFYMAFVFLKILSLQFWSCADCFQEEKAQMVFQIEKILQNNENSFPRFDLHLCFSMCVESCSRLTFTSAGQGNREVGPCRLHRQSSSLTYIYQSCLIYFAPSAKQNQAEASAVNQRCWMSQSAQRLGSVVPLAMLFIFSTQPRWLRTWQRC